ncbi:MAG: ferrous iron transporter B [Slackia sp.]|nr:ferrous iron transporter B [Slackia sp.]
MAIRIALAGNPNCGKTTLFNGLTGSSQYVGNWPGVTVEKKEGAYTRDAEVTITDLPGIYSLSPYSPEEIVTRDYLITERPDVVVNIVDATNLERNLYLTTQILDLGLPVTVALNMADILEKNGDAIDLDGLSKKLGCPVVAISALKGSGIDELMRVAIDAAATGAAPHSSVRFDAAVERGVDRIERALAGSAPPALSRWYAIKMLEGERRSIDEISAPAAASSCADEVRDELESMMDDDAESIVTSERYDAIAHVVADTVRRSSKGMTLTQKIDRVVTNRWLGLPLFALVMTLVYFVSVSTVGTVATDWANDGVFGDGWLYTGTEEFKQAEADYQDEQAKLEAYVTGLYGADSAGVASDRAQQVLDALAVAPPEDAADEQAAADYAASQEIVAAFDADARAAGFVASHEAAESDGSTAQEDVTFADYEHARAAAAPDPADFGLYIPGIPTYIDAWLTSIGCASWLHSLIVDGIVAGVGAVLGFIPQMIVLFLMLSFLEACGYMARVAFIMDRVFRKFGLSGKSFIPMLIASGCGVPAIMATKTIENERDRRMTVMTATMIPCGAKLPIIALVFGALAGQTTEGVWWVAPLFYFLGVAAVVISGIMLRKTRMFAGEATPFIMELPQYRMPAARTVLMAAFERVKGFVVKAGTVIFLASIVIWALLNLGFHDGTFGLLDTEAPGYLDQSLMAMLAGAIAPLFAPLGFGDWQSVATSVTGLVAKENVVSTVGIITSLGDAGETDASMWQAFSAMFAGSAPAIMAFCAFNLLCAPCFAAIGTIRRQMASAKWTWFAIGYMTAFAYAVALVIYQFGTLLAGGGFGPGTIAACLVLAALLFQLVRPMPDFSKKSSDGTRASA